MIRPGPASWSRNPFPVRAGGGQRARETPPPRIFWRRRARGTAAPPAFRPASPAGRERLAAGVRSFLARNARRLGIGDPSQLVFSRLWESRSGAHVRFQQALDGVSVIGGIVDVHLDREGTASVVTGAFHGGLEAKAPRPAPPLAKGEAVEIARADLGRGMLVRAQVKCRELFLVEGPRARAVFKVVIPASRPLGNWVYLVDAGTGRILRSYNTMRFARGRGRVYLQSPAEEPAPRDVVLERLATPLALKGAHVEVVNADRPEAVSESGDFAYPPDDTHFDEVMAYFHVDMAGEFFRLLDPALPGAVAEGGRLRAFVHAGRRMDNAYFDPSTLGIYLGDGGGPDRMNDLAKESAVIYHEYGHAVLDSVNPHLKGAEADALHEGYADYFACSLTDDAEIGEWAAAARGEPHLRTLRNGKRYPRDLKGEAHADGEIWGGACWEIRRAAGSAAADSLVYESMHFLPEFARFSDAALGAAQAAARLFGGRHAPAIERILAGRGLCPPSRGR